MNPNTEGVKIENGGGGYKLTQGKKELRKEVTKEGRKEGKRATSLDHYLLHLYHFQFHFLLLHRSATTHHHTALPANAGLHSLYL